MSRQIFRQLRSSSKKTLPSRSEKSNASSFSSTRIRLPCPRGVTFRSSRTFHSQRELSSVCQDEDDDDEEDEEFNDNGGISEDRGVVIKSSSFSRLEYLREKLVVDERKASAELGRTSSKPTDLLQSFTQKSNTNPVTDDASEGPSVLDIISKLRLKDERRKRQQLASSSDMITDTFNRVHTYLRISLAERCNLRCQYCMPPDGVPLQSESKLLTKDEIMRLTLLFAEAGVDKVRLTGGEPLLRSDLSSIISSISSIPNIQSIGITTNGITLSRQLPALLTAGLSHINISLDTLQPEKFLEITRRNGFHKVMKAIKDASSALPSGRVKINCVLMKGFNDDELRDFVMLTKDINVDVRFIEWMPFNDNGWNANRFFSYKDMLDRIQGTNTDDNDDENIPVSSLEGIPPLRLTRITDSPNDTTKWYRVPQHKGRLGFITSMSEHFCGTCNRLRITADGKLKVCLFGGSEVSLRDALRMGEVTDGDLSLLIEEAVKLKKFKLGGHGDAEGIRLANDNRPMTLIGG